MSLMPFVVAVEPDDLQALNEVVKRGLKAEREWLASARKLHGTSTLRGKALSEARKQIRKEFQRLRNRGRLAGTRDLVVAREVRAELKARKLTGPYDPVPTEEATKPGRRVGASPRSGSASEPTTLTARMAVRLPGDLADQLTRSCYWTSAPAVTALWEWQERWGDGPEVILREAHRSGALTILTLWAAATAPRPDADAIMKKADLQAQIITTGDIIRAAVQRAIR
ncbi:hypothetical protein [Streptomyces sp. NPDC006638]|uniref:hypothetical protein n=1 Tax=Streptomyces sp. NPDC006638 TaxID=3157183 RepID=UPI0033A3618F